MNPDKTNDSNAVSLYETSSGTAYMAERIDGTGGTAALKVTSRASNLTVSVVTLRGGSENCVDVNNEVNQLTVTADRYEVTGKYAISAKTSRNCTFQGHIVGRAKRWEVNLGSWSDQSKKTQASTWLKLTAEHYPIRVWVGNSTIPFLDDPKKYKLMGFGRHGDIVRKVVMFFWDIGKRLNIPGV